MHISVATFKHKWFYNVDSTSNGQLSLWTIVTLNKFHTSFGVLEWWYGNYLCKFFWLKLYIQYLLSGIYYVYCKEETQLLGLFFTKGVAELVVKMLDKYAYKEFLKQMHCEFLKKFLKETLHFSRCWLFLKKWNNESFVI